MSCSRLVLYGSKVLIVVGRVTGGLPVKRISVCLGYFSLLAFYGGWAERHFPVVQTASVRMWKTLCGVQLPKSLLAKSASLCPSGQSQRYVAFNELLVLRCIGRIWFEPETMETSPLCRCFAVGQCLFRIIFISPFSQIEKCTVILYLAVVP